jgi:nucleoside-diphosphate-sugar epimerase
MMQYWEDKTVIVTGGFGFIGSHFVEEFLASGAQVICIYHDYRDSFLTRIDVPHSRMRTVQVDLLEYAEFRAVCKYVAPQIDVLVHCAALDGNSEYKINNAARILDSNLRMTSNILNCAHDFAIQDTVLMSSAEIYSPLALSPIKEEDDYRRYLGFTENGYVLSKTIAEVIAELYRKDFGMNIFLPRPTNVYGPRDNVEGRMNRVIPSMMKKILAREEIEIWGDGSQTRQFVFVKDLVRAVMQMVETSGERVLNIANNEQVSILELATILTKLYNREQRIRLDQTKPIGVKNRVLDLTKLDRTITFRTRSLTEGLLETMRADEDSDHV